LDFFTAILVLFVLGMVNFAVGISALGSFLKSHPRIGSIGDLEEFKQMVRRQMYQAILQIVLLGGMTVVSVIGILTDRISFVQFLSVLILDGVIWYAGKRGKKLEKKAKRLPVEAPELAKEFGSVCRSWFSRPFPDF
jgi:hypothetical protein